jgi:branched-chain amino acid transport system permease protein
MTDAAVRRGTVVAVLAVAIAVPLTISDFYRSELADAAILGILVLSLVLLTGFVGQISFCQYSFAALGAFTVGSLVGGHHWSFWLALLVGVAFASFVGVLVAIPALRLRGLFLAILTVAVALFFDRYLLAPGTWDSFSGGLQPWEVGRPAFLGIHLEGSYAFYLFTLGAFTVASVLVWNLRQGKTGRVLRAIRESEIAAATMGVDVTAWKLLAFGVSAGLAGLAGGLLAAAVGSVSPPSFDFLHSVQIAALATVMGVGSVASAAAGGFFLIALPELLHHTPLSADYFPLIVGAALVLQLQFAPEGAVVKAAADIRHLMHRQRSAPPPRNRPKPRTRQPVGTR